jgi:hypothetical protein
MAATGTARPKSSSELSNEEYAKADKTAEAKVVEKQKAAITIHSEKALAFFAENELAYKQYLEFVKRTG